MKVKLIKMVSMAGVGILMVMVTAILAGGRMISCMETVGFIEMAKLNKKDGMIKVNSRVLLIKKVQNQNIGMKINITFKHLNIKMVPLL